jgi:hypothetical protein
MNIHSHIHTYIHQGADNPVEQSKPPIYILYIHTHIYTYIYTYIHTYILHIPGD